MTISASDTKSPQKQKYTRGIAAIALLMSVVINACAPAEDVQALPAEETQGLTNDTEALAVETVAVRQGRLRDSIEASGTIQGIQEVILRPFTNGVIQSVDFELGDQISANDTLVQLDSRIARLTWQQLSGEYQSAVADLESQRNLYNRGSISLNQLNQVQARVDGLAARLERARDALNFTAISSPISGRIAEKSDSLIPGDLLASGQQIARVVDLSRLRIQLSLGQDQIFLVREGLPASIVIPSPQGSIGASGQVSAVAAGSDQRTGSWRVVVSFDNPDPELLKAGMSGQVSIQSDMEPVRNLVPLSSLVIDDDTATLYVAEDGVARMVSVELLDSYGELAAVRVLDEETTLLGSRVLVSGLSRIEDGDRIVSDLRDIAQN